MPPREARPDRGQQEYRELAGAVHGDPREPVRDGPVHEAPLHRIAVGREVYRRSGIERRQDLRRRQRVEEGVERRIPERRVIGLDAPQRREVGKCEVRAVQDADLGLLVGMDVLDELRPGGVEIGAHAEETIVDHPLREALAVDREVVGDTESFGHLARVPRLRAGRDPVHHRAGKRHVAGNPRSERRLSGRGQVAPEVPLQHRAVLAQVVAAKDRQGPPSRGAAFPEGRPEIGVDRALPRAVELGPDLGAGEIEPAVVAEAVAALGDRHRQQPDAGVGDDVLGRLRASRPVEERLVRPHETEFGAAVRIVGLDHVHAAAGAQPREVPGLRGAEVDPGDRPAQVARALHHVVEVHGLVGAVKGPHPDVHDADPRGVAVIAGALEGRLSHRMRHVRPPSPGSVSGRVPGAPRCGRRAGSFP